MSSRSLQEDLLRIPGVEGADVEGSGDKPAGLRIRIAEGADQQAVGGAIRHVLTEHGLGTDTRLPGEPTQGQAPSTEDSAPLDAALQATEPSVAAAPIAVLEDDTDEPEQAAVIDLTDHAADPPELEPEVQPETEHSQEPPADPVDDQPEPQIDTPVAPVDIPRSPKNMVEEESSNFEDAADSHVGYARIQSVAVAEGRDGITVTVSSSDGRSESQQAATTEGGVESAVVRATAQLAVPGAPAASVVEIEERRVEGVDIVMIVLDVNGVVAAGSAVVGAGRAFALGRATWAALSL